MKEHQPAPQHELEEAAQGHDLYRSPGSDLQWEDARDQAEASGWLPPDTVYDWPSVDTRQRIINRRQDLYDAMRQLEANASRASGRHDWLEGVCSALAELDSALQRHITEIEETDGLFVQVLDRAPHLQPDVERLRMEHKDLITGCRNALEMVSAEDVEVARLRRSVLGLLGRLVIHRHRGSELLFDAYNVDLAAAN